MASPKSKQKRKEPTKSQFLLWCEWWDEALLRKSSALADPTLCVRYPTAHLLTKKQFTELFFLTFAALLGFKSHHIYIYKQTRPTKWWVLFVWCEWWDLNPYVGWHTPLKRACLPVPAHSQIHILLKRPIIISKSDAVVNTKIWKSLFFIKKFTFDMFLHFAKPPIQF